MTRLSIVILSLALLSGAARAADWTVDPSQSVLGFTSSQAGEAFKGHFNRYTAAISFDPAHPEAGHVVVLVDMTSAVTGDKERDRFLPEADWFDASRHAQAKFEATGFTSRGNDDYETAGTLTIRDKSQKVTLPFKLTLAGETAHAVGALTLNRTDYAVGQGQFTTPDWVPFEVGVTIDITAKKAPGS